MHGELLEILMKSTCVGTASGKPQKAYRSVNKHFANAAGVQAHLVSCSVIACPDLYLRAVKAMPANISGSVRVQWPRPRTK